MVGEREKVKDNESSKKRYEELGFVADGIGRISCESTHDDCLVSQRMWIQLCMLVSFHGNQVSTL